MPVIAIFSETFCNAGTLVQRVSEQTGYPWVDDARIVAATAKTANLPEAEIRRAFSSRASVFNPFTHEKESAVAFLRLTLADLISRGPVIISGFSGLLIPQTMEPVCRIGLTADVRFRVHQAKIQHGLNESSALSEIHAHDVDCSAWTRMIWKDADLWQADRYDRIIFMDQVPVADAAHLIQEVTRHKIHSTADDQSQTEKDFFLAATLETTLCRAGHTVSVCVNHGDAILTIDRPVLSPARLKEELAAIAGTVPGVRSVAIQIHAAASSPVYQKRCADLPLRILLVDDEREFVQTLSERISLRNMGAAIADNGESALALIREDAPDVMVLDLKMPGMDGISVLDQVKQVHPEIEVIVLSGHGSENDRKHCMALGAFACLQKPVDIEELADTIKKAYAKNRKRLCPCE